MDASELDGLSAEELIAKKDSIEAEIKANYDLLETVSACTFLIQSSRVRE